VHLYEKLDMLDNTGKIVCIPALEYLKTRSVVDSVSHAQALTGTITINIEGASVDELEIYEKYHDTYPDITINYGPKVTVKGAHWINFYYEQYTGSNDPSMSTPYFSKPTTDEKALTLAQIINTDDFTPPEKAPTETTVYNFNGLWVDAITKKQYFQNDGNYEIPENVGTYELFSMTVPESNMYLFPKFNADDRTYSVQFCDDKGNDITTLWLNYDDTIEEYFAMTDMPIAFLYCHFKNSDIELQEHERLVLQGWISEQDWVNKVENPPLIDLKNTKVKNSMKLYGKYVVEDARKTASHISLFDFVKVEKYTAPDGTIMSGVKVNLNPKLAGYVQVKGKITIPTEVEINGKKEKVIGLGSMHITINNYDEATGITSIYPAEWIEEIYFLEDSECTYIDAAEATSLGGPLSGMEELRTIYFPNSM
jgi:hypothetical protein